MSPGTPGGTLVIQHEIVESRTAQEVGGGKPGLATSDDDYIDVCRHALSSHLLFEFWR